MQCALIAGFTGDSEITEDAVTIGNLPRPALHGQPLLLVKVLACSLAAGDVHLLRGRVSFVLHPPAFPYVPGV